MKKAYLHEVSHDYFLVLVRVFKFDSIRQEEVWTTPKKASKVFKTKAAALKYMEKLQ